MITIETPNELPAGIDLWMRLVKDEAEAVKILGAAKGYLFRSKIIDGLYLFTTMPTSSPLRGETEPR
jgi:hypothetical protein